MNESAGGNVRAKAAKAERAAKLGPCEARGCTKKVAIAGACFCAPHGRDHVGQYRRTE